MTEGTVGSNANVDFEEPRLNFHFVCEGNICRSPLAELIVNQLAVPLLTATSAGIRALEGSGIDGSVEQVARELGYTPGAHVARQVDLSQITPDSIVLAMTKGQRDSVARMSPTLLRRTFTLVEFYRIIADRVSRCGTRDIRQYSLTEAWLSRGKFMLAAAEDMEDPFRKSLEKHREVASRINDLCVSLIDAFSKSD